MMKQNNTVHFHEENFSADTGKWVRAKFRAEDFTIGNLSDGATTTGSASESQLTTTVVPTNMLLKPYIFAFHGATAADRCHLVADNTTIASLNVLANTTASLVSTSDNPIAALAASSTLRVMATATSTSNIGFTVVYKLEPSSGDLNAYD